MTGGDADLKAQTNYGKGESKSANGKFPEMLGSFPFCLNEGHRRLWKFCLGRLHLVVRLEDEQRYGPTRKKRYLVYC
jgi:hypothetical protein